MDNIVYLSNLFECYKNLFTQTQQNYFVDYYFNNLTLSEIAENYNVSRNAIHKNLKETEKKLIVYEEKLNIYKKIEKIKNIVKNDDEIYKKILEII